MSDQTSTWASVSGPAPMPMVGMTSSRGHPLGHVGRHHLQHHRERPGGLQGQRVLDDALAGLAAALDAVAAERVLALRGEPEMGHHRDAGPVNASTWGTNRAPPSSLTACAPPSFMNRNEVCSACLRPSW